MYPMVDYKVLSHSSLDTLEQTVKAHLRAGWVCVGGVAFGFAGLNNPYFYQAIGWPK